MNKPDVVRDRVLTAVRSEVAEHRGIEGREQCLFNEKARAGDPVEQARFARVRVSGNDHRRNLVAAAVGALGLTSGGESSDLFAQASHPSVDASAIKLDLCLTRPARPHARPAGADLATGLS